MPVLTLALPTYNRAASIGIALESLAAGLRGIEKQRVELLVQDNASTDRTQDVVKDFISLHPELQVRYLRNSRNLGYDGNHLAVYREALGEYLMFCSDRYAYSVPFLPLIELLEEQRPAALTFSDRFRPFMPTPVVGVPGASHDDWLGDFLGRFGRVLETPASYRTDAGTVTRSGSLKHAWIAQNVSDVIVRRDENEDWLQRLASFEGTYLLVVAAMCHAFEDPSGQVEILKVPWFSSAFERMATGGARHDNLKVAYGHVRLADSFPFVGTHEESASHQLRVLLRTWLPIASGAEGYELPFSMRDIVEFAQNVGVQPGGLQKLMMSVFEGVEAPAVLRLGNSMLSAAVWATRMSRRVRGRTHHPVKLADPPDETRS